MIHAYLEGKDQADQTVGTGEFKERRREGEKDGGWDSALVRVRELSREGFGMVLDGGGGIRGVRDGGPRRGEGRSRNRGMCCVVPCSGCGGCVLVKGRRGQVGLRPRAVGGVGGGLGGKLLPLPYLLGCPGVSFCFARWRSEGLDRIVVPPPNLSTGEDVYCFCRQQLNHWAQH